MSSQILHAVSDVPTSLPLLLVLSWCKCVSVVWVRPSVCVPAPPWALWDAGSPACVRCLIRLVRLMDSLDPFSPSVPMNRQTWGLIIVQLESARTLLYTKTGEKMPFASKSSKSKPADINKPQKTAKVSNTHPWGPPPPLCPRLF